MSVVGEPTLLVGLGGLVAIYVRGWRRSSGGRARAVRFALAVIVLLVALGPAIESRADRSLPFHMLQHQLLTLVVAPLLATSGLAGNLWHAIAPRDRPVSRRWDRRLGLPGDRAVTMDPRIAVVAVLAAAALHLGVILLWHLPALYGAALANPGLHHLEHLTMLGTAVLFWMAVVTAAADDLAVPGAVAGLAMVAVGGTGLGLVMLGAPLPLYGWYGESASALDQQRLAGALMKVTSLLTYAGAAAVIAVGWLQRLHGAETPRIEVGAAGRRPS